MHNTVYFLKADFQLFEYFKRTIVIHTSHSGAFIRGIMTFAI